MKTHLENFNGLGDTCESPFNLNYGEFFDDENECENRIGCFALVGTVALGLFGLVKFIKKFKTR